MAAKTICRRAGAMKKLLFFALVAASTVALWSCARNTDTTLLQGGRELTLRVDLDEQSRIVFDESGYAWVGGEAIGAYVMSGTPTLNEEASIELRDGAGYCNLSASFAEGDKMYAYFPYLRDNSSNMPTNVVLEIPDQQIQSEAGVFNVENMPMVARPVVLTESAQSYAVKMYGLGGFLRINVFSGSKYAGEHVQSISYATTDDAPLAGSFNFDMTSFADGESLAISGYSATAVDVDLETVYTVTSAADKSKGVYMVLAPGTYNGKLTITTDQAVYVFNYNKTIERNTYYDVNANLDNAERIAAVEPIEATLTYAEVKAAGVSMAYGSPKTYSNKFGEWTVCAYDYGSAFQINSGKVAYIGTPVFEGAITEIVINTVASFTGTIAICTSNSVSSAVVTQTGGGATTKVELADKNLKQIYILSSANACRISDITVYCGGGGDAPVKPTTPKFVNLTALVEGASSATATDGCAILSAEVDYNSTQLSIVKSGIAYKLSTATTFIENDCGASANPEIMLTTLRAGNYDYYAYAQMSDGNTYKSDEASFIILNKAGEPVNEYKYGWFELPLQHDADNNGIEDTNADLYYSHTFRADASSIRNFSACYSKGMIHPVWVAAPMHKCYLGSSGRNNSYRNDPNIGCTQNSKFTGYTRGHMIGSSDRTISVATNKQVFYYSNIGAQLSSGFNTGGGAWNNLESQVDGYLCADTLYQVVGCVFKTWTDKYGKTISAKTASGANGTFQVPTAWYKVLLRTKKGNTGKSVDKCSADELQCVAFILGHYGNQSHKPTTNDMYSVTEVEKLTGLTFFPNVPNAPKSSFQTSDWGL